MRAAIYSGTIAHQRYIPRPHCFQYSFFMWFLPLDELHTLPRLSPWFSHESWALNRFYRPDYLGDRSVKLADAVRERMKELTGHEVRGTVCGLLNMRTLGLYFSPVNFYYGFDEEGGFSHFLAEVSNIPWNERHHYAHYVGDGQLKPDHPKQFHVSPFNPDNQHYHWHLGGPGETISVGLDVDDKRGRIFEARLNLERQPLTLKSVCRQLIKKPVMTAFVVAGIYYQASRLFLKKVPYIPYDKETA